MKKGLVTAGMLAILLAPVASQAHNYDRDDSDYPLRYVAYAVHPVGVAVEYLLLRPIHCLVSLNSCTNNWFGHESWEKDWYKNKVEMKTVADATGPASSNAEAHDEISGLKPIPDMDVIYFDYDKSNIRKDQLDRVEKNLKFLKDHPNLRVVIEGNCDERGTTEYNFALGERRAKTVREYFEKNGISADRLLTVSHGEEKPADTGHSEAAWAKNRRDEFKEPVK